MEAFLYEVIMDKPTFENWFEDSNLINQSGDKSAEKLYYNLSKDLNIVIDDNIDWSKYDIPQDLIAKVHYLPQRGISLQEWNNKVVECIGML